MKDISSPRSFIISNATTFDDDPMDVVFPPKSAPSISAHHRGLSGEDAVILIRIGMNAAVNGIFAITADASADIHRTNVVDI